MCFVVNHWLDYIAAVEFETYNILYYTSEAIRHDSTKCHRFLKNYYNMYAKVTLKCW